MPEALDQSWGFADPKAAKAAGVQVVSMYLSRDASKNMTASDVKAYHKAGIAMLFNWENEAGAPLKGAAQGKADAEQAVKLAKQIIAAVGYRPKNRLVIYFSCDQNVTPSQYPAIDAYYRAAKKVCQAAGFGVGCYGEADLVSHLSSAGITDAEWQTYAWSGGVLSPAADFYQYQNGQHLGGADVDFDRIIHPTELGAWWPPGSRYDTGEDMGLNDRDAGVVWAHAAGIWNKSKPSAWAVLSNLHMVAHAVLDGTTALVKAVGQNAVRLAAIEKAQADQGKQLAAVLTAVSKPTETRVQIDPVDVPVTGTLHVGGK